jgi:hypothetical protein
LLLNTHRGTFRWLLDNGDQRRSPKREALEERTTEYQQRQKAECMASSRTTSLRRPSGLRLLAVALAGAACLTLASTASAGVIPENGWNLDNVTVSLNGTGSSFDPTTGDYVWGPDSDYSFQADIDNGAGEVQGIVFAKDYPIGEPPGIKIVNDDFEVKQPGRPTNCILATSYLEGAYLDAPDPEPVVCSSEFQTHKRFKVAMLPTTVDGGAGAEEGIDLVFDVDPEAGLRDYQVFQKINNWTNSRLDGFKIEVGTGIGANFVPSTDPAGAGLENLSLSVPTDFFNPNQLAIFSDGLFGAPDSRDPDGGFFDDENRAGFTIAEYPNVSGATDTLSSGAPLVSNYETLFGPWLPNNTLPKGFYFDDDNDPETDPEIRAWYGVTDRGELGWMYGVAADFAEVPPATIAAWEQDPLYSVRAIDDLVNVNLNYVVTVGDTASFTIRVTPSVDTSGTPPPARVSHAFLPVTPTRVLDTRNSAALQLGDWDGSGPLQAGSTVAIPVRSAIPAGSPVAVVNVTATRATEAGFLTVYPCDTPIPNTSNLNYLPGVNLARAALAYAPVSAAGQVCVYTSATTDLIVDVSGYTPSGGFYTPRTPQRLADTRSTSPLAANATLRVTPPATGGDALAISVTSVNPAAPGFLTAYTCDDGQPAISTSNYTTGTSMAIANLTIVGTGDICVTTSAQTDVLVDLQGVFTEPAALGKARLLDSRSGAKAAAGSTTKFDPTSIPAFAGSPMAAVNVTATRATEAGFLTVWNCADPLPNASAINYEAGDTFAIANVAMLKTTSPICVYTSAPTDIILDLVAVTP